VLANAKQVRAITHRSSTAMSRTLPSAQECSLPRRSVEFLLEQAFREGRLARRN
jgi:hypothetical protein